MENLPSRSENLSPLEIIPEFLNQVEPIEEWPGLEINENNIYEFIEPALRSSVLKLIEKGCRTIESSANIKDVIRGKAFIAVDLNSIPEQLLPKIYDMSDAVVNGMDFSRAYDLWVKKRILNFEKDNPKCFVSVLEDGLYRGDDAIVFEVPVSESTKNLDIAETMEVLIDRFF